SRRQRKLRRMPGPGAIGVLFLRRIAFGFWGAPEARTTEIVRQHEVGDARGDFRAEPRSVEHAVMADPGLQPVWLVRVGNIDAKSVRRLGLTDARDVVVLAFDGHQSDTADLSGLHRLVAVGHDTPRQGVADEYGLDRLEIELGGQVHHGEILVV